MQARQSLPTGGDFVDLRVYLTALRRRALVIIVLAILGLGLGLGDAKLQTPIYTATAEVLVNAPPGTTTQNLSNVISVDTEAQVVKSAPIADAAAKTIGTTLVGTQLLKHVSVTTTPNSFVLGISFWDPDPAHAATGANAFAKSYLNYKTELAQQQIDQQNDSIVAQIDDIQKRQKQANQVLLVSAPGTIAYRNAQDALNQLSVRLAVLASSLAALPQVVNPGQVILPANPPKRPSSPKVPLDAAIGLMLGLFFGVAIALVMDRLDDRVYRVADLQLYLDVPVLASVPHVEGRRRTRANQLVVHLEPRSPVSEAYRTIRTSVLSLSSRRTLKVLAFASPVQGEGKSMTCANVAAALGQADKRVLVLSADLRKPSIHEFFFAEGKPGLSEVLEGKLPFGEAVQKSEIDNVWILSGGGFPPNPAELLGSSELSDLLASVRDSFDIVIVDCPPILGLADCLSVLPLVDAVVLVVQAGRTHGGAIIEAADRIERVGVRIDAVVINDVEVRRGQPGHGAYGYYLASQEYLQPSVEKPAKSRRPTQKPRVSSIADSDAIVAEEDTPGRSDALKRWGAPSPVRTPSPLPNGDPVVRAAPEPSTTSVDEV